MNEYTKNNYRILIIDDEQDILELLRYNFEQEGYQIKTTNKPNKVLDISMKWLPHVIILDVMMPGIDGVELCRRLRENAELEDSAIIILSARSEEYTQVAAYESGADVFLAKPVRPRALLSRIQGMMGRKKMKAKQEELIASRGLTLNLGTYQAYLKKQEITLPKKEFQLLFFMMKNEGRILTRDEILAHVWGADVLVSPRTVDVHVRKIREKIGQEFIKTSKGVGYMF